MTRVDWKRKLSSRKFWAALISVIIAILTAFNIDELTISQVVTVVSSIATLIIYILAESYIDNKNVQVNKEVQEQIDQVYEVIDELIDAIGDDEVIEANDNE